MDIILMDYNMDNMDYIILMDIILMDYKRMDNNFCFIVRNGENDINVLMKKGK